MNKPKEKPKPKPRPIKMELTSMDIVTQKRAELTALLKTRFPELVREDGVNFDQLKRTLGENVEGDKERFGLQWHGKTECMRIIQQPSIATLKPARDESSDFDKTENLFIEGDNLEVLKLLQKSYFGKVKMIYIDPPYNTGKEFIYPDKYKETLDTYLKYTGQIDADGRKFSTNTDTVGRYHSNWLNMMYPRLYLARNLLRDDGVIFISIDDNEQSNLKALCDEIFGEENLDTFVWHKSGEGRYGKMKNTTTFRKDHEYVLVAYKNIKELNKLWDYPKFQNKYDSPDNDKRGAYKAGSISKKEEASDSTHKNFYTVKSPSGKTFTRQFDFPKDIFTQLAHEKRIYWGKNLASVPALKIFINERRFTTPSSLLKLGSTNEGTEELNNMFPENINASNIRPKPYSLVFSLIQLSTNSNDIVLDFFAGSATTAHAVMQLNAEDGGSRKYICVQLPEPTADDSEARKAGYKNIADIGKERIRRAAKKIAEERPDNNANLDLGFKVFKLAPSNFKVWESEIKKIKNLQQQLSDHINHVEKSATAEALLYELLLKSGEPLTTRVKKIKLAKKDVFSIDDGALLICLDKSLNQEVMDAMADKKPSRVICLDEGFKKNDQLKTNAAHTFKVRAQQDEKEIVFMTV